jgi:hypothetical protein
MPPAKKPAAKRTTASQRAAAQKAEDKAQRGPREQRAPAAETRAAAADDAESKAGAEPAGDAAGPTVDELRARAAELDVAGRSKMNREQLVEAIAAAETAGDTPAETDPPAPPANVIDSPVKRVTDRNAKKAPERGIYLDGNGRRRVVAAGAAIPPGWELIDDSPIEDRAAASIVAGEAGAQSDVGSGGATRPAPTE